MTRKTGWIQRGVVLVFGMISAGGLGGCETPDGGPGYWSDPPRSRPIRSREWGSADPEPPPYTRAAQERAPRSSAGRTRAAAMVQRADNEAQESLEQAKFQVERAFDIAQRFARGLAAMEIRAARREALASLESAQSRTTRAMETAVSEADRFEQARMRESYRDGDPAEADAEARWREAQRRERNRARELDRQWRGQQSAPRSQSPARRPAQPPPPQDYPSYLQYEEPPASPPSDWSPPPAEEPPPYPPSEPGPPPDNWGADG